MPCPCVTDDALRAHGPLVLLSSVLWSFWVAFLKRIYQETRHSSTCTIFLKCEPDVQDCKVSFEDKSRNNLHPKQEHFNFRVVQVFTREKNSFFRSKLPLSADTYKLNKVNKVVQQSRPGAFLGQYSEDPFWLSILWSVDLAVCRWSLFETVCLFK